jgi:N-acetylglucosamine-6-sulfatase
MYANIPVCCPSRSGLYSGQYQHNHRVLGNAIATNCSSPDWQAGPERTGFATYLAGAGYVTSFAGKYLNCYGLPAAGGVAHVPPGWTNWQGLVGNSVYYDYTLSNNGVAEAHGHDYDSDYLPNVILNKTLAFIAAHAGGPAPFAAVMSTPSCHGPADPAPQYSTLFPDAHAPRTPAYNASVPDVHWLQEVQGVYGLDANAGAFADLVYRRRVQTLQTVDDMITATVAALAAAGVLDNTYILYTTDNGYHVGTFGFIYDKREPWLTDTHLPLFIRGPGIPPATTSDALVTMPDVSATLLDIAGVPLPAHYDGASFLPFAQGTAPGARLMDLVEYHGETSDGGDGAVCARTHGTGMFCNPDGNYSTPPYFYGAPLCVCQDVANNTYNCLRVYDGAGTGGGNNFRYCEFADDAGTVEFFNYTSDPFELSNGAAALDPAFKSALHTRLASAAACIGSAACQTLLTTPITW